MSQAVAGSTPVTLPVRVEQVVCSAVCKTVASALGVRFPSLARSMSSWRSWIARLPPKEQVARSNRAGDTGVS